MKNRKVTYRLYPNQAQHEKLLEMLAIHLRVYNESLEARIRIYREEKRTHSFADQCKTLTRWRKDYPSLAAINAQSLQVTLKRLDLAFQAFFRRVKAGQKPGFPRFKSLQRFSGWGYKTNGDGWKLIPGAHNKHGKVRLSGIGIIRLRGKARTQGEAKTSEIIYKAGQWYLSVTIACDPTRHSGTRAIGIDWGVTNFLTIHDKENTEVIDNPRYLQQALGKLKLLQQSVARKKNKKSNNRKAAVRLLAKCHQQIANRRKDFHHKITAKLIKENGLIGIEKLSVKSMIAQGGARKKGLNREILSTAPTLFHSLLKLKAEEAGAVVVEVEPKKEKPSQTCYQCHERVKKTLSERWHFCECGASCDRDENSARVILSLALKWASGQELAEMGSRSSFATLNQETLAISSD